MCLGDIEDMKKAISLQQLAANLTPDGHVSKPTILNNLGSSARLRFERLGDIKDLEEAISLQQSALDLMPEGHDTKPTTLSNLGNSFELRFRRFWEIKDLEEAISFRQAAINLTPDGLNIIPEGHPDKPTGLNNVGGAVQLRFERLGDVIDLENAISLLQAAVDLTPDGHPDKPSRLNNLGVAVQTRFERLGDVIDLENAISLLQAAGDLMPDGHPDKPSLLNNIGSAVQLRFERLGDVIDLENAISLLQAAVDLTPDGHLDKPSRLNNLGGAVQLRFERLRDVIDLENAISFLQAAVDLTPDGHPDKPGFLSNLGDIFLCRFRVTNHPTDLQSAICSYSTSANSPCGPSIIRFRTAAAWARTSHLYGQYPLTAFECVMTLLPQVAWLGSSLRNQRAHLTEPGDVVRYAVAVAIELQEYETAVRWAEHGRSIIWQNLLSLRNPMDDLHKSHSELAIRLKHVSQQLQGSLYSHGDLEKSESDLLQDISNKASILAAERDKIVEQVRQLPGFEYFLKAKSFDTLAAAAYEGPVAIINVSERRCDALVLIPHDSQTPDVSIVHIPLESFSHAMSEKLFREFNRLLSSAGVTRKSERESLVRDKEGSFKSILHPIWLHVVKPILDGLAYQPGNQSRIWWCVTGPLAFLPIHAAGNYETDVVGEKISDYVVSSYTPTLTAILDQSQPEVTEHFQILTVAQPSTPHAPPLPETEREVNHVKDIAGDLCVKNLINEEATAARVMQAMKESNWIHLACHGLKHESDPLKSGFLLHDRTLELSELIQEPLPKADFAFLSSCCGNGRNPNFAKDLVPWTAGVLFLGFKGMIGTAWSIQDEDGPKVTKAVYERMLKDGKPNRKEAARALHEAVKELRESGADFLSWVPFIHIGR
ncbi:hypothetical protein M408DRAFT_307726 [Serendipita vermifera MAFF 305830]|uniref:CHAT domain-containing protein n=1 Tax=Serendipita vermifera MAFF 305830 TaxID=933852 RepID=A0A0C2WSA4_SERVB|nr:hypothetical protein M408DRAFT_307726 [Serendipita vermifera MAFF 305830]